ncbi:MAG TPA: multiprotein-bridging factor 1 family protein [Nitrososphaeraceae archaeon]|nr:multiprotein-bridging factor 1 family protein [Nitrososphaeraceae archaeon]
MPFCELCGNSIQIPKNVIIDGSIFNVCLSCSKRGKPYEPKQSSKKPVSGKPGSIPVPQQKGASSIPQKKATPVIKKKPIKFPPKTIQIIDEKILRPDFGRIIREARMKKGITQENVAHQLSEKITLYKKIETGGIKPNEILSKKLERVLGIQLYENLVENNENENEDKDE